MASTAIFNGTLNITIGNDSNSTVEISPPFDGGFIFQPPPMPQDQLASFKKYALIITNVIGIIGNMIVFYIFTRTKLKRPSTSRYLAATAIADTGYLLTVMLISMGKYNDVRIYNRIGLCQLITFGQHAFPFLMRWYLTALVIEKYIGVMWPRKKSQMCTVFRAKCVIISLAIMAIVCYLYVTYFFVALPQFPKQPPTCGIVHHDPRVLHSWILLTKMDAVVNFAVPYIIMFILMCLVACKSWQYRKRSQSASERFLRRRRITTPEDKEFKTTPLLIALVACTLILCVPNSTSRLRELSPNFVPPITESEILITGLFHYFEVLNSSIKIFVYTLTSKFFAKQIAFVFCVFGRLSKENGNNELQSRHVTNFEDSTRKSEVKTTEGVV